MSSTKNQHAAAFDTSGDRRHLGSGPSAVLDLKEGIWARAQAFKLQLEQSDPALGVVPLHVEYKA